MTAHQLGKLLLECENVPVLMNGFGTCEGVICEVAGVDRPMMYSFSGEKEAKVDSIGFRELRLAVCLRNCEA